MLRKITLFASMMIVGATCARADSEPLVVLELFTSQGCSSCPPADALLKRLAADDADLLPLSFHVDYWDNLGWKDTYSSSANTDRQKLYAKTLGLTGIFTPQLIVNGKLSVTGSDENAVRQAIAAARQSPLAVDVSFVAVTDPNQLAVMISSRNPTVVDTQADIWEVKFDRSANTVVTAGENSGHTLQTIGNVTGIRSRGIWHSQERGAIIQLDDVLDSNVAIIVQMPSQGPILGANDYIR